MAKEIIKEDIPKVQALLQQVLGTAVYADLTRMGGLTNHTYKVTMEDGAEYVVRIPGEGTEELIVRKDEMVSTKITRYIKNAVTMSADTLKDPLRIQQMADIFRKMHACGVDTGVPFEVFDMAAGYEKIIGDNNVPMYDDYAAMKAEVMRIKAEVDASVETKKVPCHNDALCENWVVGDDRMYLIDWEYAGMNDGMWDVADVSIEACFDAEADRLLLSAYLDREPTVADEKHFLASKIYVDFLWTLWAKTRVPYDGQPMEDWALERYTRLKGFVEAYNKI